MTTFSQLERAALVEALREAGPDAPTLCEGWTTNDLAAHLVARERRPDSGLGIVVPLFAGWTERVRRGYARRPYGELVDLVASGPPRFSPFALPGADASGNLTEHLVHCEDVRRASGGWKPRTLPGAEQDALWKTLAGRGKLFFRRSKVGITVARPDGTRLALVSKKPTVVLTGEPAELTLFAFGRGAHAVVDLDGPADAVAAVRSMRLGI